MNDGNNRSAAWWRPRPQQARRSIDLVRWLLAAIIAAHPIYTIAHPLERRAIVDTLAARGLPLATVLTWAALLAFTAAACALLWRRLVLPAALTLLALLAAGGALFYAAHWYVAGGESVAGHPGAEFNVLLCAGLASVLWAYWPGDADADARAQGGLKLLRVAVALLLLPHCLNPFLRWDVAGMRAWGNGMSEAGWPCGVALVWTVVTTQTLCSFALLARRLVVPACAGLIFVLGTGTVIEHYPDWFIVGPGGGGMEFPLCFIGYYVSLAIAYAPRRTRGRAAMTRPLAPAQESRAS